MKQIYLDKGENLGVTCPRCGSMENFSFLPHIHSKITSKGRFNITKWDCQKCQIEFIQTDENGYKIKPECLHDRFCDQQNKEHKCNKVKDCNFKDN